jgi:hypothetical protein
VPSRIFKPVCLGMGGQQGFIQEVQDTIWQIIYGLIWNSICLIITEPDIINDV